jgi:hypothetical protein
MRRITPKHLEKHGMTAEEYKQKYGELTFVAKVRAQLIRLFDPNRFRWAQQLDDGYRELQYKKTYTKEDGETYTIGYWLTDSLLNTHFTGKNTISIFPSRHDQTSFLVFDVDARDQSATLTRQVVSALYECGINREDIHVSFSGSKGYHVELFWSHPVPVKQLERFGTHVKSLVNVADDKIEIRPRSIGGNGIKLPLGFHRKTGAFCGYVDNETLEPIANPYHYFLAIEPIDPAILELVDYDSRPAVSLVIHNKDLLPTREEASESAKKLYENGLITPGTRHNAMLKIALWMRDEQGLDKETAERLLMEWVWKQYARGMISSSMSTVRADLRSIIKDVFVREKYRLGATTRQITLSSADIQAVYSVKQKSARLLYFALILHGKMYCRGAGGTFTVSQRQLKRLTKLSEHTIKKARDYLATNGFIQVIEVGWMKTENEKRATKFHVPQLLTSPSGAAADTIELTVKDDIDCRQLLVDVGSVFGLAG